MLEIAIVQGPFYIRGVVRHLGNPVAFSVFEREDSPDLPPRVGEVYLARIMKPIGSGVSGYRVSLELGHQALLHLKDIPPFQRQSPLQQGDCVCVQIFREAQGQKLPCVTGKIQIKGRYAVYILGERGISVSKKLSAAEAGALRACYTEALEALKAEALETGMPSVSGELVIRTEAAKASREKRREDLRHILAQAASYLRAATFKAEPKCLYRIGWSDWLTHWISEAPGGSATEYPSTSPGPAATAAPGAIHIRFGSQVLWTRWLETLSDLDRAQLQRHVTGATVQGVTIQGGTFQGSTAGSLTAVCEDMPGFGGFSGLDDAFAALVNPVQALPSGGNITIHSTEAFTVMDVNTSGAVGVGSQVNEEAVSVALQWLHRTGRGGITLLDLVGCEAETEREAVLSLARGYANGYRGMVVHGISRLGILEITTPNQGNDITGYMGEDRSKDPRRQVLWILNQVVGSAAEGEATCISLGIGLAHWHEARLWQDGCIRLSRAGVTGVQLFIFPYPKTDSWHHHRGMPFQHEKPWAALGVQHSL